MANDTHTTELNNTIKTALRNYEGGNDVSGWARMESVLATSPKSTSVNWKALTITSIIIVLLTGGYFLFNYFDFSKFTNKPAAISPSAITPVTVIKETKKPTIQQPIVDSVLTTTTDSLSITTSSAEQQETTSVLSKEQTTTTTTATTNNNTESALLNKPITTETTIKKKRERTENKVDSIVQLQKQVIKKANENTLAPAVDSVKSTTVANETKTKEEELKPKVKPKRNSVIGWNALMFSNLNTDSLKKYRERIQKDTVISPH